MVIQPVMVQAILDEHRRARRRPPPGFAVGVGPWSWPQAWLERPWRGHLENEVIDTLCQPNHAP